MAEQNDAQKQADMLEDAEKRRRLRESEKQSSDAKLVELQEQIRREEELQARKAQIAELKEARSQDRMEIRERRRQRSHAMKKDRLAFTKGDRGSAFFLLLSSLRTLYSNPNPTPN